MTYGIAHKPLLATVQANRRRPDQRVAFIGKQLCFFERHSIVPPLGATVEVMITRPVHPRDERDCYMFERLSAVMICVVDPAKHMLVAIDGFECSGSMCSTTSFGCETDGSRQLERHHVFAGAGRDVRHLRDSFTITPGRSGIRFADNVNAKRGEWLPTVPTNVWVDLNTRTGKAERQPRGGNVRVAGLTRLSDLAYFADREEAQRLAA